MVAEYFKYERIYAMFALRKHKRNKFLLHIKYFYKLSIFQSLQENFADKYTLTVLVMLKNLLVYDV